MAANSPIEAGPPQKYKYLTFHKNEISPLSAELQKKAEVELNELASRKDEDLEEFRNMVAKESQETDLRPNMNDAFLLRFLRARKYNKERALKLVKNYYRGKKNFKSILNDGLKPSQVMHVFEKNVLTVLPNRDPEGRVMILFQAREWKPSEMILDDVVRALYLMGEKLLQDASVQICGLASVLDVEGLSFAQVRQFRPMLAYALVSFIQDCVPARLKAVHIVKENALIDLCYAIIKPFLKPKLKKRLFFHGYNLESFHKQVPREMLPKTVGGTMCDKFDGSEWTKVMMESDRDFEDDFHFGYPAP